MVPIVVWKTRRAAGTPWPQPREITSNKEFQQALAELDERLARQAIVWIEGDFLPATFQPVLPPGLRIAGRGQAGDVGSSENRAVADANPPTATGTSRLLEEPPATAEPQRTGTDPGAAGLDTSSDPAPALARLAVRARSADGRSVMDLRADEMTVSLGGQATQVVSTEPWRPRAVLFIASELCSRKELAAALHGLAARAELLLGAGAVTVVVADPLPRIVADAVDTAEALRRLLHDRKLINRQDGRAVRIRRSFLAAAESPSDGQGPAERLAQYVRRASQARLACRLVVERTRGASTLTSGQGAVLAVHANVSTLPALTRAGTPNLKVRVSVGISVENREPAFHHLLPELVAVGDGGSWLYRIPITFPHQAIRLAVVVEDLDSGAWGAEVAQPLASN